MSSGGILGLDYASVDGNSPPHFDTVKAQGVTTVIIRGAWGTSIDSTWRRDFPTLRRFGFTRGAYLFLRYDIAPEPQAEAFAKAITLDPGLDLPPILDVEFPKGRAFYNMTAQAALDRTTAAWRILRERYGVEPMIYTSARVWFEDLNGLPSDELSQSPLWLAKPWPWAVRSKAQLSGATQYQPLTTYGGKPLPIGNQWFLYQYQGDAINFPGFTKTVDINRVRVFSQGAKGDHVAWVQRRLGLLYAGKIDGDFGPKTLAAVRAYQQAAGLVVDGFVGPRTFCALAWRVCERGN